MSAHEKRRELVTTTAAPLEKNATVGRYLLRQRLAIGGMSEVWLAQQATGGPTIALKALLPHLSEDPDVVRMFHQEGRVGSELLHRNLVHVLEHGCDQGRYWIAMELVEGRTLRQVHDELRRKRRLPPIWFVVMVLSAVCSALHWAQMRVCSGGRSTSLVHRDISPDNVIISFDGIPKLLDFGIARVNSGDVQFSGVGTLKGKAAYMAPEQIQDPSKVGPEADVYSIGVVLYEMLTGQRPFQAPNDVALIHTILNSQPKPPSHLRPSLAEEIDQLVMRTLARSPSDRFASAGALKESLDRLLTERPTPDRERTMGSYLRGLFERSTRDDKSAPVSEAEGRVSGTMRCVRVSQDAPPLAEWDQEIILALERTDAGVDHPWDRALRRAQVCSQQPPEPSAGREPQPPPPIASEPVRRSAHEWFELGLEHARKHEDALALSAWQEALRLQPDNRHIASNVRMLQRRMEGSGR